MSSAAQLNQAVHSELKWEPSIASSPIGVIAKDGFLSLLGHVATYCPRQAAETGALRVKGVAAVAEEIEVKLPFETKRGDDDIVAAVVDRLSSDAFVPTDALKVKVEQGWVTIIGLVDWNYRKTAGEQGTRWLFGVAGVSNKGSIKVRPDTGKISDDIGHALHSSLTPRPPTSAPSAVIST